MRRLSMLLAAVCILAVLLVVPVCAAGLRYQFDMLPSVSLLPDFGVDSADDTRLIFYGYLPEGTYDAELFSDSEDSFAFFTDYFDICYVPDADTGYSVCSFTAGCVLGNIYQEFSVTFVYDPADDVTYFGMRRVDDVDLISFDDSFFLFLDAIASADSADSVVLKEYIRDLFGPYEQQTEIITQTLADGSTVTVEQRIPGIAGLDYEWFAAVCLFGLVLYCFFRLLGGVNK